MTLASPILSNRAQWLVKLRWIACAGVVAVVYVVSSMLGVLLDPTPLYLIAVAMLIYNSLFGFIEWRRGPGASGLDHDIFIQIALDQVALTLLLYFSGISHNPFIFYFVFHLIIATLLLRGWTPYVFVVLATCLVGGVLCLQHLRWIPVISLSLPHLQGVAETSTHALDRVQTVGIITAFASTLWITVYLTSSVQIYMHRVRAEVRQKEKMLGIGQLVAGISHQISNPLDGIQNCLHTISERIQDDAQLSNYVRMMTEALDRIERTAKRVQAFARPHGLKLQDTDVSQAIDATIAILGAGHVHGVEIVVDGGDVPLVRGDPYTLQEVIFNLCTNALAAMPDGGTLSIRSFCLDPQSFSRNERVAIEVVDTGVGIPEGHLDRIFEPFFTTRADSGGTGLGLGLCRMLLSEMDGSIDVQSKVGCGTTFQIALTAVGDERKDVSNENTGR
jgi:signal transduction histidine kinase